MAVDFVVKNNLRKMRRTHSEYTQQELADIVDCTRQTIIALEQNKYNPSLALALRLAAALELKVEELFWLE